VDDIRRGAKQLLVLRWDEKGFSMPVAENHRPVGESLPRKARSASSGPPSPPIFRIRILGDCCLAPPKAGLGFGEDFEGIFEIQKQFLPAQTEVRRAKHG